MATAPRNPFRNEVLRNQYRVVWERAPTWFMGRDRRGRPIYRRGSSHRDAFWNGYLGQDPRGRYVPGSASYVACRAGRNMRRHHDALNFGEWL